MDKEINIFNQAISSVNLPLIEPNISSQFWNNLGSSYKHFFINTESYLPEINPTNKVTLAAEVAFHLPHQVEKAIIEALATGSDLIFNYIKNNLSTIETIKDKFIKTQLIFGDTRNPSDYLVNNESVLNALSYEMYRRVNLDIVPLILFDVLQVKNKNDLENVALVIECQTATTMCYSFAKYCKQSIANYLNYNFIHHNGPENLTDELHLQHWKDGVKACIESDKHKDETIYIVDYNPLLSVFSQDQIAVAKFFGNEESLPLNLIHLGKDSNGWYFYREFKNNERDPHYLVSNEKIYVKNIFLRIVQSELNKLYSDLLKENNFNQIKLIRDFLSSIATSENYNDPFFLNFVHHPAYSLFINKNDLKDLFAYATKIRHPAEKFFAPTYHEGTNIEVPLEGRFIIEKPVDGNSGQRITTIFLGNNKEIINKVLQEQGKDTYPIYKRFNKAIEVGSNSYTVAKGMIVQDLFEPLFTDVEIPLPDGSKLKVPSIIEWRIATGCPQKLNKISYMLLSRISPAYIYDKVPVLNKDNYNIQETILPIINFTGTRYIINGVNLLFYYHWKSEKISDMLLSPFLEYEKQDSLFISNILKNRYNDMWKAVTLKDLLMDSALCETLFQFIRIPFARQVMFGYGPCIVHSEKSHE
jgi:hypothetical protein